MANLTRDQFVPLLDSTKGAEPGTYTWVRIDKSTTFELSFNPQEETVGYIDSANDSTYIKSYAPELPQEIILDSENACYKLVHDHMMSFPTGTNAVIPVMLVWPSDSPGTANAMVWDEAVVSPGTVNTIDGKDTFTLKLNGTPQKGTATALEGNWTFSPTEE